MTTLPAHDSTNLGRSLAPIQSVSWCEPLLHLLDKAAADPALGALLMTDALAVIDRAEVHVTGQDFKQMLGVPFATDAEVVEMLRARLTQATGASCGCGG